MSIDLSRPSSSCAGEDYDPMLEENNDVVASRRGSLTHTRRLQRERLSDENDDTEDQAQMDLVLNTNFDLGLFDCNWSDDMTTNISQMNANITCDNTSSDDCNEALLHCGEAVLSPPIENFTGGVPSTTALHPQAISSSADCPPIETSRVSLHGPVNEQKSTDATGCSPVLSRQSTSSTAGSNQSQSHDWTTNPSKSLPSLDSVNATPTISSIMNDSFQLSSQLQELIARQSATQISNNTGSSSTGTVSLPPFLLFDAPIELRANFIAAQQAHGFPILDDNNTFHYQHPPQFSLQQQTAVSDIHLVDGRHGGIRNKRVKNAREQKRTQKITDLIDQLRDKMEEGGWKVGGTKSKYATLSTCAEYVKHLVKATKEQEQALEKTKHDLKAKRQKIDDDNEYQQDPSDPESTISSITVSSGSAKIPPVSASSGEESSKKKRISLTCNSRQAKKSKGHIDEKDSDLNDANGALRTSRSKNSEPRDMYIISEGSIHHGSDTTEGVSNSSCSHTAGGVSSVGAVARGLHSRARRVNHADVIVKGYKKRATMTEATSMDSSFKLDYEEVFVKSSVPQLLATTAGRIVSWNDIFLKASGLLSSDIDSLTIFSLVRHTELVKLFEIVAAALRSGKLLSEELENDLDDPSVDEHMVTKCPVTASSLPNYTAITLPCAAFRHRRVSGQHGEMEAIDKLLYMTVTLMADKDPKKRCFHCVFTDSPGTNGALGSVTPELLSMLFKNQSNFQIVDRSTANNVYSE